jgi:tetratricopeptide (TPR) repeat protein
MPFPLCFVLMPFDIKADANGLLINFDVVYRDLIAPAIRDAELEPLRADEEMSGGIIHKPMFERLVICEYAVADLTTANANVFYELGIRHAVRPWSTVLTFAKGTRLPFDVGLLRGLPYTLDSAGKPANIDQERAALTARLNTAKGMAQGDSPLFTLLDGMQPPDIKRLKTDSFRDRVDISNKIKERLADARRQGADAVRQVEASLKDINQVESAAVIDLFLSYRAVKGYAEMISLVEKMPKPLATTVMVKEQMALALNRLGQGERAEQILLDLIQERGPSSETYGLLGRVYKDRWSTAVKNAETILARGLLDKAINAYLAGFQADWRDAYPGINAVTLMELRDPPDPRRNELVPVVRYAVSRRIAGQPDYWDYATLVELEVLAKNQDGAMAALGDALAMVREIWEPETTANNLNLIIQARQRRNELEPWVEEIKNALLGRSKQMTPKTGT